MKRWTRKAIDLREKFSQRAMVISLVIFLVSLLIYNASNNVVWIALTGFVMVIFGSIIVLFLLVFLIFWFLEKMTYKKKLKLDKGMSEDLKKNGVKKKVSKKGALIKKKSIRKDSKKKVSKKKVSKKK